MSQFTSVESSPSLLSFSFLDNSPCICQLTGVLRKLFNKKLRTLKLQLWKPFFRYPKDGQKISSFNIFFSIWSNKRIILFSWRSDLDHLEFYMQYVTKRINTSKPWTELSIKFLIWKQLCIIISDLLRKQEEWWLKDTSNYNSRCIT